MGGLEEGSVHGYLKEIPVLAVPSLDPLTVSAVKEAFDRALLPDEGELIDTLAVAGRCAVDQFEVRVEFFRSERAAGLGVESGVDQYFELERCFGCIERYYLVVGADHNAPVIARAAEFGGSCWGVRMQ